MDDIYNFIRCHGLIKDEIVKDKTVLGKRCYAFEKDDKWVIILWNDERTIMFEYGDKCQIELWHAGKKLFSKQYKSIENPTLLSACLQLYEIQDTFVNTEYETFSKI